MLENPEIKIGQSAAEPEREGSKTKTNHKKEHLRMHRTTRTISNKFKNIIVGSFLGDGCIPKNYNGSKTNFLKVSHSIKQREYAEWKSSLLDGFATKPYIINRLVDGKPYQAITFETKAHPFCNQLRACYIDGNKQVKNWITSYIDPLALTIWYLDDGDLMWRNKTRKDGSKYKYIGGSRISLGILTDKSCRYLDIYMKATYGIDLHIKLEGRYKRAYLNMENTIKLIEIVKDIVPDCMRYKISLQHDTPQKGEDIVWSTRISKGVEGAEMTPRLS